MSTIPGTVKRAQLEISRAALGRWIQHTALREAAAEKIRRLGPGAGDSMEQRTKFAARQATRFTERMIGKTWDATPFAPNEQARAIAKSVARLVTMPGAGFEPEGFATGFLVTPRLLMTNHHVFPTSGAAVRCGANLLYENTERGTNLGVYFELDPATFYFSEPFLDFALVAVKPRGTREERLADYGFIPLIESTGKILKGNPINIIQHPNGGARQYAVKNNSLVDVLPEGFLHYETDTAPGTSGAPAFNEFWELVAVHHCGIPAMKDGYPIRDTDGSRWDRENDSEDAIRWLANEGSRVSFIMQSLRQAKTVEGDRELLEELLATPKPPPEPNKSAPELKAPASETALPPSPSSNNFMPTNVFNISGNVTINVSGQAAEVAPGGAVSPPAIPVPAAKVAGALESKQIFDPRYAARQGYETDFLGIRVPLPVVAAARGAELYTVADYQAFAAGNRLVPKVAVGEAGGADPVVLHYYHYSIIFNKKYRMAAITASNADYREAMRMDPRNRGDFGGEDWRPDPRVPLALQLIDKDIYGPAQNIDRGHLVRREDNCWGAAGDETSFANADSYHWTNCTPQHELFNQERPKGEEYTGRVGIWGAFEAQLQKEIDAGGGQVTLFSGPILGAECRSEDFGTGVVRYPVRFWKVAVVAESTAIKAGLKAYGFVFDQSAALKEFGLGFKEGLKLVKFEKNKAKLKEIEEWAGITFDAMLHAVDQHR